MKRILLVGLGNPGQKFEHTRHNLGIEAVKAWAQSAEAVTDAWHEQSSFKAELASVSLGETRVDCMFPLTFMNDSGMAVAAYAAYYNLTPADIILVHDELELPLGEVGVKETGSAQGHNGVRSIQHALNTQDIKRIRIGIGRPTTDIPIESFVLQQFPAEEQAQVESAKQAALALISQTIEAL